MKKNHGFTLIELLIAVSIFAIAVAISMGGFVRALRTQRQIIALISANSSASLAIEQMARAIRTGRAFDCVEIGGTGTCDELTFTAANGSRVTYLMQDETLKLETNDGEPQPLLPDDAQIRYLGFILLRDPQYPPRVTVNMGVTARSYGLEGSVTNLQTTVSSRNF